MSRQINFFAAEIDAAAFHIWLLTEFPDMAVIFLDSALHQEAGSAPQPMSAALLGQETVCLIPAWAKDSIVYCPPDSMISLEQFDSPVLEYSPSVVEADKECVKVGRIYWAFRGNLKKHEKKQINSIFRWIQSHSESLPMWGKWRIFPHARRFRWVRQWVGDPEPNPLFKSSSSETETNPGLNSTS